MYSITSNPAILRFVTAASVAVFGLLVMSNANAAVKGSVTEYTSTNGVVEQCIALTPMPSAHYSKHDLKTEQAYCDIDFSKVALCPKLWSTSPATNIFEIDLTQYDGSFVSFEKQHCTKGHHVKDHAVDKLATFKISVNSRESSATYAPSSLIYYHLSRYFSTATYVPIAVYRSVDKDVHNQRVVKPALNIVADRHGLRMLTAGWEFLDTAETGGDVGSAGREALTSDGKQVSGIMLDNKGDRYGVPVNGTRESGWGAGQNHDFQQTAPFLALRSDLPVDKAIEYGIHQARSNPKMAKKLPADTSAVQVAFWMNDILEITLLDYILGQQDRVGNIDYRLRWFWLKNGKIHDESADNKDIPTRFAEYQPVLLKQSAINDNDAGVRSGYVNFAQKTGMLDGLRHYNPHLYKKLTKLAEDMQSKGPVYQWFVGVSGLSQRQIDAIAKRVASAHALLKADVDACKLKLDLAPKDFLYGAKNKPANGNSSIAAQPCVTTSH